MKKAISSSQRTRPSTIAPFVRLGFVGLFAVIVVVAALYDSSLTRDGVIASAAAKFSAAGKRGLWYVRLGQWRADTRTLVAAIRYVLESDTQTDQRKPAQRFPGFEVAMPTNSTSVWPKA